MNVIQQLRADVNLPAGYRVKLPVDERKKILHIAIIEYSWRKAMGRNIKTQRNPQPEIIRKKRNLFISGCTRVRVAKYIAEFGPVTAYELAAAVELTTHAATGHIATLKNRGHVVKTGKKRKIGVLKLTLYEITDAGREYGAQADRTSE